MTQILGHILSLQRYEKPRHFLESSNPTPFIPSKASLVCWGLYLSRNIMNGYQQKWWIFRAFLRGKRIYEIYNISKFPHWNCITLQPTHQQKTTLPPDSVPPHGYWSQRPCSLGRSSEVLPQRVESWIDVVKRWVLKTSQHQHLIGKLIGKNRN